MATLSLFTSAIKTMLSAYRVYYDGNQSIKILAENQAKALYHFKLFFDKPIERIEKSVVNINIPKLCLN
jgi:hypothetical protein